METSVEFKSDLFKPFLPEEAQVNPNVFGAELAYWLCQSLARRNIVTSYPENEDWGWYLEYFVGNDEFMLGCINTDELGKEWNCYLKPQSKGLFSRKSASIEKAEPLLKALRNLLEETPEITDIVWIPKPNS